MAAFNVYFIGLIAVLMTANAAEEYKLELVQVLFRHGDRYPNDNEVEIVGEDEYTPIFKNSDELGQLTTTGMAREYKLGQMLRKRYDYFLSDYKPGTVYARSTYVDRTMMSLQLVLASLYPPTIHSTWNDEIPWRPIPTTYVLEQFDFLKIDQDHVCMGKGKLLDKAQHSADILKLMEDYQQIMLDIKNRTAMKEPNAYAAFVVHSYLAVVTNMGLPLPEWCPPQYYPKIREAAGIFFDALTLTLQMKRMVVGSMVEEILKNIATNEVGDKRKIYLYSAHDTNVGTFTHAHNFTDIPAVPDFGSAVIVEKLRGADKQTYLRMYYWTGIGEKLIPVKVQHCDYTCLVSDYVAVVEDMIPSEEEKSCYENKLCV